MSHSSEELARTKREVIEQQNEWHATSMRKAKGKAALDDAEFTLLSSMLAVWG